MARKKKENTSKEIKSKSKKVKGTKAKVKKTNTTKELTFSKTALINSKAFSGNKDVLNSLIKDDEMLSMTEVNGRIDTFMNKKGE